MFRITTFSRGIHSPQQGLGIANICLENARKTKDPELALELCGDADEVIAQVTKAMKRSTTSLNHSDDQGIREELATAYVELGRLQDGLGQGDKARANIKNSESWGLLQTSQSPNDVLDPVARDWLLATQNDTDERERLDKVATDVIIEFKRDEIKDVNAVAEVICLAPVLGKDEFRILLRQFYDGIDQSSMLNLPQLQGLAQVIQGASTGFLDSDDLVKILELLSERLRDTHRQSSHHIYELTLAVSHVLDAMADIRVKGLDREKLHEPLSGYLDGLKGSSDPYLVYQAAYAYQALQCVPDNETLWQATLRRTGKVIQGASGLVSAAKALDLNGFVEGLGNIQQGLAGVPKAFQLAKSAYGDVAALAKSGKNFMSCLKEGLSFERKQAWYSAIRGADVLIRNGQLAGFKKLVCEAPCRRDPAFQWGVCQRLGEIAASTMWDTDTRSGAVAFLGEIYQNDAVWGQQTNIKQWILNILMQLATTAEDLFEALETDGDVKKRALYHGCREDGATLYPLKVESPALTVSPLLDRVQNKPDVEGTIRQLRKQRMNERGDAVYISPQGKASLQAADDARFPLMEKVNEFLAGNRKVFLLLGDSGAGKSTFNRALEYELWHAYNKKDGEIPLYISLPSIDKPEHDMIPKQLRRFNFTDAEITELKFHRNFLLICDGYDESQLTQNLYMSNRLNQTGEWNARMVISCRSEYIGTDYRDRFQPGDRNRQSDPTQLQEAVITPFSIDQIQDYIAQYVSVHQPLWRTEDYQETLRRIPSLMELVKNPFLLTLSLEVLPRMVDPGQRISATQVTRVTLYDQFIEQWLERGKRRLGEKELSPQAKSAFESLTDEGFTLNGIDFLKKLSVAIYKEQGGQPVVEYSRFKDEGSWKSTFFSRDDEKMLLREACPLTRSGNQYRFIHRSLLEYGLSRSVFDPLDYKTVSKPTITPSSRRGSTSSVWSFEIEGGLEETISAAVAKQPSLDPASPLAWRSFVNEPSLLQFLSERVKQEPIFKQQLFNFIEQSKDTKGWRTAAANAMTILVRAGVQLNAADLQGIQIPGADLSYGVFDSAQLQGADLRKVTLRGACLRQADLSGARMRSVEFGELPYLEEDGEVYSCVYSPDGRWFVVGVRSGNVSVYTTSTWEQQWILLGHKEGVECPLEVGTIQRDYGMLKREPVGTS
ncbi:hypothetical protein BGX31_004884 [Mortierella sp. GBA43]|nr:hypothetical protein BGX31_004884 [Mortierella sp. GBA43]